MGSNSSVNRHVKLLLLLASAKWYSRHELIKRLEISERAFYRYIHNLRECGVVIVSDSELEDRLLLQRMIIEKKGDYVSEDEIQNEVYPNNTIYQ